MVSFQSAYLRVHHPAEFMAAVLSNQGGYYRPHAYIAECRRMRLHVDGPDINLSRWRYYGRMDTVVVGLMAVKGISRNGAADIIKARAKGGDFQSLTDFMRRVKLSRDDIIALCPAGTFDSIAGGLSRALQARALLGGNAGAGKAGKGQADLFAAEPVTEYQGVGAAVLAPVKKKAKAITDELWEEYNALGFLRRLHPLALWKDRIVTVKRIRAIRIGDYLGRYVCLVGWPVTQKEVWTKDGLTMSFLTFEDETALYETVIFPKVYDKYNRLLFDQRPLLVYGRVMEEWGAVSVEVSKVEVL